MIIINSAAYVGSEFRNEIGFIPPCFLPLGNQKLLQHQVSQLRKFFTDVIIVSLPESYKLSLDEHNLLVSLEVEMIAVPDNLTLGEALVYVLNVLNSSTPDLRLLHGDTLIHDVPSDLDVVSVSYAQEDYDWEVATDNSNESAEGVLVWSGFFSFSDKSEFLRNLVLSKYSFVEAVLLYSNNINLEFIRCNEWFDLGHINSYFLTRSTITTQRSFNILEVADCVVYKSSKLSRKIEAESFWFREVPSSIKKYTPNLLGHGRLDTEKYFYILEYLPYLPLNELFVHGRNPASFWFMQIRLLQKYFNDARGAYDARLGSEDYIFRDATSLYQEKTLSRLEQYERHNDISLSDVIATFKGKPVTIKDIADDCIKRAFELPIIPAVLHGDLCFSNILFDSRLRSLKVIDPRGINCNGVFTIYGDLKYDLAKIAHSVIGLYDYIIAGRYTIVKDSDGNNCIYFDLDERTILVQQAFMKCFFIKEVSNFQIMPLVVLLFLSMLPLHDDYPERQHAMLLNAIRIYKML